MTAPPTLEKILAAIVLLLYTLRRCEVQCGG